MTGKVECLRHILSGFLGNQVEFPLIFDGIYLYYGSLDGNYWRVDNCNKQRYATIMREIWKEARKEDELDTTNTGEFYLTHCAVILNQCERVDGKGLAWCHLTDDIFDTLMLGSLYNFKERSYPRQDGITERSFYAPHDESNRNWNPSCGFVAQQDNV